MKRAHNAAKPLGRGQKAALISVVVLLGFGLGFTAAHLLAGYIAYWDIVSGPLYLTLRVAFTAAVIAGTTGVASGYVLAKGRFPGRDLLETIGSLPIILPPTVVGYYLLEVLSPGSRLGGFLTRVSGHVFVYNSSGCIIAAAVAAYPFCLRAARAAIEGVDPSLEQAARTMGLPNWRVALQVTLPLARRGIAAGLTIGCARALGEYGATLMVGGDINGKTRTLSLAILDSFTTPERDTMLLILVLMAIIAIAGVGLLGRSRGVTAALELALTRQIGEFDLDVAFTVESGMSVLFGPSGAGKSLTLALIAGHTRPDAGTITINGHVVTDCARRVHVSTQQRRIGMVFQDGLLLPHRSVLDNVALAVRQASGRRARREVARSWLERVGADAFAERRPGSLSGGQRQRVALARSLAGDPALLLLDEPLSALDSKVRGEMRQLVRGAIIASGVPAVLVTHDADEAEELGDVIIAYKEGRVTGTRVVERAGYPELPQVAPEQNRPA